MRSDLAALTATALQGLRARLLLTVASVVLTALAVAAAVVGPMYQSASAASFLVAQLRQQPAVSTGVTFDYTPPRPTSASKASKAAAQAVPRSVNRFFADPESSLWTRTLPMTTLTAIGGPAQTKLLAAHGICARLIVSGRCPRGSGEMLMLASDAAYTHSRIGDPLGAAGLSRRLTIVGTYSLRTDDNRWFDATRFASLLPEPSRALGYTPYIPAPFIVGASTMTALAPARWFVRMDYRLRVPAATTLQDLHAATHEVARLPALAAAAAPRGSLKVESENTLASIGGRAQERRTSAEQTVAPAVLSLILVALVLLARLLSAAMELRRPELALASLRGVGRRQLWALGLFEPALTIAFSTPIGAVLGFLTARVLASTWLVPGLPVVVRLPSVEFAAGVVLASLAVAALAVRTALSEPLSAQISTARRPERPGRWLLVVRLALVAATVVVVATTVRSGRTAAPAATDLLLPILLALAAGLLTALAAAFTAARWATVSGRRRGVAGYVASRTIARRREGTWVILPLAAALAIAVFASGIYSTAAHWRASSAATRVGADTAFRVKLPLLQAVSLTHQVDPEGSWLMAAGAETDPKGLKVILDAPRLSRVAVWPSSWTPSLSVRQVSAGLAPERAPLTLDGHRVQLTVDNRLEGPASSMALSIDVATSSGADRNVFFGPFRRGRSTSSVSTALCRSGCMVTGLTITGPGTVAQAMRGAVLVRDLKVDGRPVPYFTAIGWRDANTGSIVYGPDPLTGTHTAGAVLRADIDSHGQQAVAALTPRDVPAVLPVLVGRTANPEVVATRGAVQTLGSTLDGTAQVRPIGTTESTPFFGPAAVLVDYTSYARAHQVNDAQTTAYILARSDTPQRVLDQLAAHGISSPTTLQQVRRTLDQDAYALALNLYLVVAALVLLLALTGVVVNTAVQMPARRRVAASLRVVGLSRGSIVAAVASEFTAVLGTAAVAGVVAGTFSQYLVVRTLTLGYADDISTPRVLSTRAVAGVGLPIAIAFVILLSVATLLGGLTVRGARTATLREDPA